MTDQPTPPLHEQVRELEADLVMCREQLAQEAERAEAYRDAWRDLLGEAAQQQADADEELIEKAARTLAFAVERNDDDVSESEMWGMCLTPESRFRYRNQARALLAANLLRDGGEK